MHWMQWRNMVFLAPLSDSYALPVNAKRKARENLDRCSRYFCNRIDICFIVEYFSRRKNLLPL